ncbi:DnaD domain protein [Enterococcus faecalis]|uniref:DnaD domain-containing protein n=1 Tax=Enterococcus faecalis TaxID=1351 RepID=UPI0025AFF1CA|nr:DnaD domain protein [Enterococcus faecalis]MDN3073244.1 DnaD domain protein [Enterococcus faecalis]
MAQRRMVSNTIVRSARFLKMPPTSQNLYFHLIMNADDDGVVEAFPIMRMIGSTEDDLKILMAKTFVYVLNDDLVTFINSWTEHNKIRKDRKVDSIYKDLLLKVVPDIDYRESKKKSESFDRQMSDSCLSNDGIGKDRLGEDRLGKESIGKGSRERKKQEALQSNEKALQSNSYVTESNSHVTKRRDREDIEKSRSREEGLKKIYHYYESNGFGTLAQKTMQDFDYWLTDFEKIGATQENAVELIIHALGIAIDRNKRNYGYVNAILRNWEQNRYLTVKDVEANDMMREQKKIVEEQKSNTGHSEYDDLGF